MSVANNQGALPQRAIYITGLITVLFWFPLAVLAGTSTLNDYNPYNVSIPNNGASVNSDLSLSGAPSSATISKVKVYYEIKHPRPSDLDVWLTCYDGGWQGDYFLHTQGSSTSVDRIAVDNIHKWDGKNPNVTWYLVARDRVSGSTGYIDFFELWVTYSVNDPPNTPGSEDPDHGDTDVSRTTNLDWSCSDPNGDTLYYTCWLSKGNSTFSDSERIKIDATGSNADPGTLDYGAHYYWRVKADDHNGGVTWGPSSGAWYFHTESAPIVYAEIKGVSFDRADVTRDQGTITATVSIKNTGNQSWTFYVGGSSIKDGDTTWYDWSPSRASKTLNPEQSGTVSLSWSPDNSVPTGSYGFYSKIFKTSSGDDFTDEDWRDSAFQVQLAPLPEITGGRLAWHSYTEYDDDNSDGYHSIDGRILVYDFSTGTHNTIAESTIEAGVQHAMNPNFSSDGRYLTFMGLPKTRTYSHNNYSWAEYLDIFVYDFRNNLLTNVSFLMGRGSFGQCDEDPVFSPDGKWIAFKYQRTDIWAVRTSDYSLNSLKQITAGAGQESGPQYSLDGNWIYFWHGDGPEAYIAKVPAGSIEKIDYTTVIDNDSVDFVGDTGVQDYFPSVWNTSRIIYTSWDTPKDPIKIADRLDENDDDDIRILNLSNNTNDFAAFNSPYPIDDSDAFAISNTLIGFSKRNESFWDLWYGDPIRGGADSLGIGESNKHNLGGEYTTIIVEYLPNEAPTDIFLSNTTVAEKRPAGTTVGTFTTADPDSGDTFTYTLVSGAGSTGNGSFTISGDQLKTAASFDYETKDSYSIRARTTDQGGLWYEEAFTITVTDLNEAPTGMSLSPNTVAENQPSGTTVGTLSSVDGEPPAGPFAYALVSGAGSTDNGSFTIAGDQLETTASFDYESKNIYSIRVRSTDQGGLWTEDIFTITISDVNEQQTGSLRVTISAQGAIDAGAQWRVVGGTWQNSGATVGGLSVGQHTVEFKTVAGYSTPGNQTVTINDGQTTAISGLYTLYDSDNDGMADGWEVTYGLNPLVDDASGDADNDGYTNLQEYLSGTIPNDSNSKPQPPTADAGADQTVDEGATVTLSGSNSSDPDDGIASYKWDQTGGSSVTLSDVSAAQPTFTSPEVGPDGESLTFQLTVTDNGGLQDTDTCIVNVTWENDPPTADAGSDQTVEEGVEVTLDGSNSTDPDDGIATYLWEQTGGPTASLSSTTAAQPTFTAPDVDEDGESLTFQLTVTDNGGLRSTDSCIVNVTGDNDPPNADAGPDQTVDEGVTVTLNGSNSTDDEGIHRYLWTQTVGTPVTLSDATAVQPTFVTPAVGSNGTHLELLLSVIDISGLEHTDKVSIDITDNGITDFPADVLPTESATEMKIGIRVESGGTVTSFLTILPDSISDTTNMPDDMIYGLIDLKAKPDTAGGTIKVTVFLANPAPDGYKWYKYGTNDGWYDFSDYAEFNDDRDQVALTLTDGGPGDDDGVANGVIIDPSGLGSAPATPEPTPTPTPTDGGGGGGCFIAVIDGD